MFPSLKSASSSGSIENESPEAEVTALIVILTSMIPPTALKTVPTKLAGVTSSPAPSALPNATTASVIASDASSSVAG